MTLYTPTQSQLIEEIMAKLTLEFTRPNPDAYSERLWSRDLADEALDFIKSSLKTMSKATWDAATLRGKSPQTSYPSISNGITAGWNRYKEAQAKARKEFER